MDEDDDVLGDSSSDESASNILNIRKTNNMIARGLTNVDKFDE